MEWTILRPHHFMQNLLTQTDYIINDGVVYSDSGDGKIPYIVAEDIAAVAAVTLTKPGHYGKKYVITGSEALSYRQATEIISNTIGKPLRFVGQISRCGTGAPRARGLFTGHHRKFPRHRRLPASRRKNRDDHQCRV